MREIDDERITVGGIKIDIWCGRVGDRNPPYRAAHVGYCVLTGPEHADLSDADLVAEALKEARRVDILRED